MKGVQEKSKKTRETSLVTRTYQQIITNLEKKKKMKTKGYKKMFY